MEEINNIYEFIQWCFKDLISSFITICILGAISETILKALSIINNKK